MKFTKLAATLLCSVVLLCGCAKNSDVVLKVNDTKITRGEFYGDFNKLKKAQLKEMQKSSKEEIEFVVLSLKERFLNDTIVRSLMKEEFEKRKIEATEEEIKAKKEEIIKKLGSEKALNDVLKENKITPERLQSDLANEVKMDKLTSLVSPVTVTDKDVEYFYNKNKEQFKINETVHAYHILLNTNPEEIKRGIVDADKKAELSDADIDKKVKEEVSKQEALLNDLYDKLTKNPKDFEKLAKEYSQDPGSKENGGDLGYVQRPDLVKEFGDVAFTQKVGTIAKAKSPFGDHIIYVTDKKPAGVQSFADVKDNLKAYLSQEIKTNNLRNLIQGLQKNAKIVYIDEDLKPEKFQEEYKAIQEKLMAAQQKRLNKDSNSKPLDKLKKKEKEAK